MDGLKQRANYEVLTVREKPLILYEDHRSLVFTLWHAMHVEKVLMAPPLLITFDAHTDTLPPKPDARKAAKQLRASASEREIFSFVEWELSGQDDDWMVAAMDLGLIGDVVIIGAATHVRDDPDDDEAWEYPDILAAPHRLWGIGHLWDALDVGGLLHRSQRSRKGAASLCELLGWDYSRVAARGNAIPIVLDFDLDCFATEVRGRMMAWPHGFMREDFNRKVGEEDSWVRTAKQFLDLLEERIVLRTIARESPYCGGSTESQSILIDLDDTLWSGELLAR